MEKVFTSALTSVLLLILSAPPASAVEPPMTTPAHYQGRIIDLAKGWQGARACAVLAAETRCYDSEDEQRRDLAIRLPSVAIPVATDEQVVDVYCANRTDLALVLYANTNYGGSSLSLYVADVWHNLSSYSFDDMTSSWRNNTYCNATAATGSSGGGLTTTWAARSQSSDVGLAWNDVVSSVFIDA